MGWKGETNGGFLFMHKLCTSYFTDFSKTFALFYVNLLVVFKGDITYQAPEVCFLPAY